MPVRAVSAMPKGSISARKAETLLSLPVNSMMRASWATSTTLARKRLAISTISVRLDLVALTLTRTSSRATWSTCSREKSWTWRTLTSFSRAFTQRSSAASSATTVAVMRERAGSWVGPTLRVSMLKPRPESMPATRASTPNLFSTRAERVCFFFMVRWGFKSGGRGGIRTHDLLGVNEPL